MCKVSLLSALLAGSPVFAKATVWKIDPDKSVVTFVVLRGARIGAQGRFKKLQGNITFNPNDIPLSTVVASIPVESIETGIGARDSDLIGPIYFNCGIYPKATFTSQKVHLDTDGRYVITGLFKLHGIQKTINLLITKPSITTSKTGRKILAISATTAINQTDYGLSFRWLHPDGFVQINNRIAVKVTTEASSDALKK